MTFAIYLTLFLCALILITLATMNKMIQELKESNKHIINMNIRNLTRMIEEFDANLEEVETDGGTKLYIVKDGETSE
tara:strand:+ start:1748 stop:1978 length:231 start_codon:yes stop_codon:yes gene_type:complete